MLIRIFGSDEDSQLLRLCNEPCIHEFYRHVCIYIHSISTKTKYMLARLYILQ